MPVRSTAWPNGTPCWVDCQVDDPVKESQFYSDLFGWDIRSADPEAGGYLMAEKNGRSVAGIGPKPPSATKSTTDMPSVWTTYLAATDIDATAKKVAAAGGRVLQPPMDVPGAGRVMVACDPTAAVFGVWQAGAHKGAEVYNEHGAYCWNELHTRGFDEAKKFYAETFGYGFDDHSDGPRMRYAVFSTAGSEQPCGGMNDDTLMPGEPVPSHWLSWFQYDNVDAGVAEACHLGGSVMMPVLDSPVGRMAVLAAPQGEVFGLIDPLAS